MPRRRKAVPAAERRPSRARQRKRIFLVTEFRGPLRRRKNGAATVHEFQKVESLVVGQGLGFIHEGAIVGRTTAHRKRYAGCGFAACDGFDPMRDFFTAPVELPAKLCDQGCGLIFVGPLEGAPRHSGDDPRDGAHAKKNRQREYQ